MCHLVKMTEIMTVRSHLHGDDVCHKTDRKIFLFAFPPAKRFPSSANDFSTAAEMNMMNKFLLLRRLYHHNSRPQRLFTGVGGFRHDHPCPLLTRIMMAIAIFKDERTVTPVSYTHLTLPTILLV